VDVIAIPHGVQQYPTLIQKILVAFYAESTFIEVLKSTFSKEIRQ